MSIRIVPNRGATAPQTRMSAAHAIPPLLFANLKSLYARRAERLRHLAEESPLQDLLAFAALIADAQQHALHDHPLTMDMSALLASTAKTALPPLDIHTFERDPHWRTLLQAIMAELRPQVDPHLRAVLENLEKCSENQLENYAAALLTREFTDVGSETAPLIWAALSLYWAQMAALIPGKAQVEHGEHRQFCPTCGSIPVSSLVHLGSVSGMRYLHCNLCECEWHVMQAKCSNCEHTHGLNYWSLDDISSPVKAESCDDCGTYLKILFQEHDPNVEPVADDLATLVLDAKMEDEGFARSSINPFLFPDG
ncbi:formate dehydrogenase accessory protein FdhE [Chimaeribacter californicus]|uniref:Protein FdhE homolog n=1 Tax=Chimaeribacter californicus TaxID=2060067 RepID=A0A2N5E8E2_9GAMM|nr:formate dehydrogenase accessory protein FdhE [Chimaeribacter californicus]PLR37931.1 formate dehydrogenase accessory protein FdhE [Chimaeribacter californicus]